MKKRYFFFLILSVLPLASCGMLDIKSQWRDTAIAIDARSDDWQGRLYSLEDSGLSVGVLNDETFVYICVTAADARAAGQVLRQGLIVWFDPKGGKDKVLGIHYPLARDWQDFNVTPRGETGNQEARRQTLQEIRSELEILGPGRDEKVRLRVEEAKGIEAAFQTRGRFVYELKVPLAKNDGTPHAIGVETGKIVGVGFDSPRLDFILPGRGMGGRIPGGFGPGLSGRNPGRIGMGRGMRNAEPIKFWMKVQLAAQTG
jgi:hypothetical protein